MLVDTHAHLQWGKFDTDREQVISRAKKVGVEHIVDIGFDVNSSRDAVRLAENHEGLYATIGVHPHNASKLNQFSLDELRRLAGKPKIVAIGEIGLDYYRNLSPRETQKKAFEAQLSLAEELKSPPPYQPLDYHQTEETEIYFFDKEMAQALVRIDFGDLTFDGGPQRYEESLSPPGELFNEYFYGEFLFMVWSTGIDCVVNRGCLPL